MTTPQPDNADYVTPRDCTCPRAERSLGRVQGIDMGRGIVRLATTPGCPQHDSCWGYTLGFRAAAGNGRWLYCPKHRTKNCPSLNDGKEA